MDTWMSSSTLPIQHPPVVLWIILYKHNNDDNVTASQGKSTGKILDLQPEEFKKPQLPFTYTEDEESSNINTRYCQDLGKDLPISSLEEETSWIEHSDQSFNAKTRSNLSVANLKSSQSTGHSSLSEMAGIRGSCELDDDESLNNRFQPPVQEPQTQQPDDQA